MQAVAELPLAEDIGDLNDMSTTSDENGDGGSGESTMEWIDNGMDHVKPDYEKPEHDKNDHDKNDHEKPDYGKPEHDKDDYEKPKPGMDDKPMNHTDYEKDEYQYASSASTIALSIPFFILSMFYK